MNKPLDIVLDEFLKIAQIPRPTHHEERISEYLYQWAKAHQLEAEQDELGAVIIEKPASAGCEDMPRVILQAHMDMVCAAEEGVKFDPMNDPIKVINNGKTLTAEGTTLGADDGIGIAIALYVLQDTSLRHGPLRAIFTTGEEDGMVSKDMNPKYLTGEYLINLDWETIGSLCNACAGSTSCQMTHRTDWESAPANTRRMSVSLNELKGGHSGTDINTGRANALTALASAMTMLRYGGISYRIASFTGGHAINAIPNSGKVVFAVAEEELDKAKAILDTFARKFRNVFSAVESEYSFEVSVDDATPALVLSRETGYRLVDLINALPNGVHTISTSHPGLVESSANVGMVTMDQKTITVTDLIRSSETYMTDCIRDLCHAVSDLCRFEFSNEEQIPGWAANDKSHLVEIACREYQKITGKEMVVEPVHAGVECGAFARKNPALDMIAIGPTLRNVHTPEESCDIEDIRVIVELVVDILQVVAK